MEKQHLNLFTEDQISPLMRGRRRESERMGQGRRKASTAARADARRGVVKVFAFDVLKVKGRRGRGGGQRREQRRRGVVDRVVESITNAFFSRDR